MNGVCESARVIPYRGAFRVVYGSGRKIGWRTFDDVRDAFAFLAERETVRVTFARRFLP
jgi:hypothetical protein